MNYRYTHAVYTEKKEPEWRVKGVDKGCLLFDGNSTYIEYTPEEICVEGKAFSVSVWVAPRAFEWDDPQAAEKGEEHLTAIAGQFNKEKKEGFLLGYQRFGRLCFQIGTGDSWITLWGEGENLQKYQWNQVTAVFDGKNGNISLFLNGEQIGCQKIEKNTEIKPAKKEKLFIGKNPEAEQIAAGTYNMFSGLMDDLKIYPYALREEEIPNKEAPEIEFEDIRLEKNQQLINEILIKKDDYEKYMKGQYVTVSNLLNDYYNMNLLPNPYRNLASVYYIYDYMSSSQESLQDTFVHEHMENGIQRIISKLDYIIEQNEQIIFSNRILESQNESIKQQNCNMLSSLENIENNSVLCAQYAELAANYTKANAYFSLASYLQNI